MLIPFDMELLKASGCRFSSGYYESATFEKRFGVDPRRYPEMFRINRNNLVVVEKAFMDYCEEYHAQVRRDWAALGVACR